VFSVDGAHPAWVLFYQSVIGMVGNTAGPLVVRTRVGWMLLGMQTLIGFFMISVVLSRTIGSVPELMSQDPAEEATPHGRAVASGTVTRSADPEGFGERSE
jgi:hypothetical protein